MSGWQLIQVSLIMMLTPIALQGCKPKTTTSGALLAAAPAASGKGLSFIDLPRVGGSTHELSFGPDGALWVSQQDGNQLLRFGSIASKTFHALPQPGKSEPHAVIADATGAWVVWEGVSALVHIDENGNETQRVNLEAGTDPHGLASDGQGRLWYTGKSSSIVGWVNPTTGDNKVYPLKAGSTPIYVYVTANGTAWFTELEGSRIGRIDPDGNLTEATIPSPDARPIAIKTAPDGSVWFTEEAGKKLAHIDAAKANGPFTTADIQEISAGKVSSLAGLEILADGTVWFQANGPDQLITYKNGTLNSIPLGTTDTVQHRIAQGPDGALWFTELHADRLGRYQAE